MLYNFKVPVFYFRVWVTVSIWDMILIYYIRFKLFHVALFTLHNRCLARHEKYEKICAELIV